MTEQLQAPLQISSFGEDEAGELYVTNLNGGNHLPGRREVGASRGALPER